MQSSLIYLRTECDGRRVRRILVRPEVFASLAMNVNLTGAALKRGALS
jgi:hypothetical protein